MSSKNKKKRVARSQSRWRFGTKSAKNFKERVLDIGINENELSEGNDENLRSTQMEFVDNQIKSSRYTILTFLPK